jgi:hypothetical protein
MPLSTFLLCLEIFTDAVDLLLKLKLLLEKLLLAFVSDADIKILMKFFDLMFVQGLLMQFLDFLVLFFF